MNTTILTDDEIGAILEKIHYYNKTVMFPKEILIEQDLHTKSILADEVRKIENPNLIGSGSVIEICCHNAFEQALQAVLKLLEARE